MTHVAFIGIGSNLDNPHARVRAAFDELDGLPRSRLSGRSSLYRSAPIGGPPQPDYINAVARLGTRLAPDALLAALLAIELRHGRSRAEPNAPRTLDLDLLLYDSETRVAAELRLPHPRMHERRFVLAPLLEIEPDAEVPGYGPVAQLLERCADQGLARID